MENPLLAGERFEERRIVMEGMIGLWADRTDLPDTEAYIRNLRDDDRLERLEIE